MRRLSALVAVMLLPLLVQAQPRLVLEPASLDFGTLAQRQTRDADVTLRNAGDASLTIQRVDATCGCTVPELTVDTLAPGASTTMHVEFNSQQFQFKETTFLKIYTDNPAQRVIDYQILANIEVPLEMRPASTLLRFPTVQGGETASIRYEFQASGVADLQIEPATWPRDWLDIDVQPESSGRATVVFTVRPDSPAGTHREALKLRTNVPEVPVVNLEADVRVVNDLIVNMDRVNLRLARPGQKLSTRVRVAAVEPGTDFALTGAEVDIPGLAATVENNGNEAFAVLEGEAMAADHPFAAEARGRIAGTLTIHTNLDSSPVLQVPVTYILRP